jgi:hypothetical protein
MNSEELSDRFLDYVALIIIYNLQSNICFRKSEILNLFAF